MGVDYQTLKVMKVNLSRDPSAVTSSDAEVASNFARFLGHAKQAWVAFTIIVFLIFTRQVIEEVRVPSRKLALHNPSATSGKCCLTFSPHLGWIFHPGASSQVARARVALEDDREVEKLKVAAGITDLDSASVVVGGVSKADVGPRHRIVKNGP